MNTTHRTLLAAFATAALVLPVAGPAMATAPGGSAKKITFSEPSVDFADEMHVVCPVDSPVLHDLRLDGTVTDIAVSRRGGDLTPGTEVITFSNDDGWITIRNANMTGTSDTVDKNGVETFTFVSTGLKALVTTSDGVQGAVGVQHFSLTATIAPDGSADVRISDTGKGVDATRLCSLAIDALS